MDRGGESEVDLVFYTPYPIAARQGFLYFAELEKQENEALFNKIKALEYPRLVRFSAELKTYEDQEFCKYLNIGHLKHYPYEIYRIGQSIMLKQITAFELE